MGQWIVIVKTLVKSSLDNYVLPGTLTGTEILVLYMAQWKRDLIFVTFATISLISFQIDFPGKESLFSRSNKETSDAE